MEQVDVTQLSFAQLIELRAKLEQQIAEKRAEELKVLADGFAKKLAASGFAVSEGIDALRPYATAGNVRDVQQGPVRYRDPAEPSNTWSGRGRAPQWLTKYLKVGRSRDEFKV